VRQSVHRTSTYGELHAIVDAEEWAYRLREHVVFVARTALPEYVMQKTEM